MMASLKWFLIRDPKNPLDLTRVVQELFLDEEPNNFVQRFKTDSIRFVSEEPIDWVLEWGVRRIENRCSYRNLQERAGYCAKVSL